MARNPFKPGEYVVGDEPLNGVTEGVVMEVTGNCVGLQVPGSADGEYAYYDYRDIIRLS